MIQPLINRAGLQQFFVRAAGEEASPLQHNHAADQLEQAGSQRVSDDKCRPSADKRFQRGMNQRFALGVDGIGRLIEDEDAGIP
jgi:hypothetical protein